MVTFYHSHPTKSSQNSCDSVTIQGPSKRLSSCLIYPVSSVKEHNRKGGKCKISRVLQSPVSSPQASPKVEVNNRPKQAQHLSFYTPGPSLIDLLDAYLQIPIHPNSRKYIRFCHRSQMFQFISLLFGLAKAPQVFTMIVKEVKLMALARGLH